MAKLNSIIKQKKSSKRNNRFLTSVDMSVIKHDVAVKNSEENRGETHRYNNQYIAKCGCDVEGCFIHGSTETRSKKAHEWMLKNWPGDYIKK